MASKSAYGSDPGLPWLENVANGWGDYCWPGGVPAYLLGNVTTEDGTVITVRSTLVALVDALAQITEKHFGYKLHNPDGAGGYTGGYENRPIGGTSTASAHSRARAIDIRAQDNPQSYTFQCNIPPEVVALWESHGFYWGGRYVGAKLDPMHFSYVRTPGAVVADYESAKALMAQYGLTGGGGSAPAPQPAPEPAPTPAPAPTPSTPAGKLAVPDATVALLQTLLNLKGAGLAVDDDLGQLTTRAILKIQGLAGIEQDGIAGPLTWRALWPLPSGHYFGPYDGPVECHGGWAGGPQWERDCVAWIQRRVITCGLVPGALPGWADGVWHDRYTTPPVRMFQQARHLDNDGLVGRITWTEMAK